MKIVKLQTVSRQRIHMRRRHGGTVTTKVPETGIVENDINNIWATLRASTATSGSGVESDALRPIVPWKFSAAG